VVLTYRSDIFINAATGHVQHLAEVIKTFA
jgi:hypothetical protein